MKITIEEKGITAVLTADNYTLLSALMGALKMVLPQNVGPKISPAAVTSPHPAESLVLGIGQIVHYIDSEGKHYPAIVLSVNSLFTPNFGVCDLVVFSPVNQIIKNCGPDNPFNKIPGTWHWPENLVQSNKGGSPMKQ